ncbi:hypothetical protein O9G_000481 [Rozella allomycis CSF55]|uniref:Snf7-domain-containing protein n=1 Tax=Rozella allomycis (strain CSF55) TaxID=988480 RepID=A0A075AU81_ROZAC|nr:hypothetical protein O9G_000481 [Rozella allomycis CSF55]|eukprot:EPZ33705.1 hypothetical protein O9G_000481 [Rozella allomycis CSF55]
MSDKISSFLSSLNEWKDKDTIISLFGPLDILKDVNPTGYKAKVDFWIKALTDMTQMGLLSEHRCVIDRKELEKTIKHDQASPLGFDAEEWKKRGLIVLKDDYLSSESWLLWSVKSLLGFTPLSRFLKSNCTEYVSIESVNGLLSKFDSKYNAPVDFTDSIMNWPDFLKLLENVLEIDKISELDAEILLHALNRCKNVQISLTNPNLPRSLNNLIIRICNGIKIPVSETETINGIYQVKRAQQVLKIQLEELSKKVLSLTETAKKYVKSGDKNMAKMTLKHKNLVLQTQAKQTDCFLNLEMILNNINKSNSEAEVLNAYKAGTNSLKSILKTNRLSIENVEETMDALEDILEEANDIDQAIHRQIESLPTINDDDIEKEFEELLLQDYEKDLSEVAKVDKSEVVSVDELVNNIDSLEIHDEKLTAL